MFPYPYEFALSADIINFGLDFARENQMATFRFRAVSSRTGNAIPVEVFFSNQCFGVTPAAPDEYLELTVPDDETPKPWYAMIWNCRIASGEGSGGTFEIVVNDREAKAEVKVASR